MLSQTPLGERAFSDVGGGCRWALWWRGTLSTSRNGESFLSCPSVPAFFSSAAPSPAHFLLLPVSPSVFPVPDATLTPFFHTYVVIHFPDHTFAFLLSKSHLHPSRGHHLRPPRIVFPCTSVSFNPRLHSHASQASSTRSMLQILLHTSRSTTRLGPVISYRHPSLHSALASRDSKMHTVRGHTTHTRDTHKTHTQDPHKTRHMYTCTFTIITTFILAGMRWARLCFASAVTPRSLEVRWAWVYGSRAVPCNTTASVMRWSWVYGPPVPCQPTVTRCLSP